MPNIAAILKDEIRRLAKREVKAQTGKTKQAVVQHRHEIASLKRTIQGQQKEIARLKSLENKRTGQPEVKEEDGVEGARFSAKSVRSQRARLKLSAADFGKLVGVSPLTIYNWEHGKSRPRRAQFAGLVAVRDMGRREAVRKLEELKAEAKGKKAAKPQRAKKPR